MLQISEKQSRELLKKRLIILGEMHGVRENIKVIKELIRVLHVDIIGFELETKWNKEFKNFEANKFYKKLQKEEEWILDAGLISKTHMTLIQELLKQKKKIYAIRKEEKDWNISEKKTAHYIDVILDKNSQKRMLVIVGNAHAGGKRFKAKDETKKFYIYKPMRLFLKNRAWSVLIMYGNKTAHNFGIIKLYNKEILRKLGRTKIKLISSQNKSFEYEILI